MESKPVLDYATPEVNAADRHRVGTLTYTKAALIALFVWLLWGDFCYTLHELVVFNVLPLTFKRHSASNVLIGVLLTTIPSFINFALNPIISTASDRTRTRWGRRLPYLALSAPINAALLILMAFSEDMGKALEGGRLSRLLHLSPAGTIVAVVAACFVAWRLTDMFVATVYYYLFSDVVPEAMLARFMALFRVVGTLAAIFFNQFVYPYAESHMREIFLGAGVFYLLGYTVMCLKVREGKYPPPPAGMEKDQGVFGIIRVYFRECFFHRFYWYFFLTDALWGLTNACATFMVFLQRDSLGLTLQQLGSIAAVSNAITAALLYFAGMLADRLHPLRFMLWSLVLQGVWSFTALNWLFWNPTPHQALILTVALTVVNVPLNVMYLAARFPMIVRLLPKERFGQFAAATAMVVSLVGMASGALAGGFLDLMKWVHNGSDFAYRYIPVWQLVFTWATTGMLFLLYREWKKRGGMKGFTPPDPAESQRGFEAVPKDEEPGQPAALVAGGDPVK